MAGIRRGLSRREKDPGSDFVRCYNSRFFSILKIRRFEGPRFWRTRAGCLELSFRPLTSAVTQNRPRESGQDITQTEGPASVNVSNVLNEENKKQVIARIEKETGIRPVFSLSWSFRLGR